MIRRALAILLVTGAAGAALVLTGASDENVGKSYFAEFDNAFGLVSGGDLKVGGVRAGQTVDFKVNDSGDRATALVEIEVQEPGFADFRKDASCRIRPQSLIGEYFVDCQPGSSQEKLAEGGVIPKEQNEGTINQDLVNNILRRPYKERFRLILSELGVGLAGRPDDLQEVLKRAHPGLRETSKVLKILADQNEIIERFIQDSDTVMVQLEDRKSDVARWVREAGETAEISASRREFIAEQFRKFPTFLDELEPTMVRLGELSDEQVPTLRDLRRASPDLVNFFRELGPFADASLPSLRSLGRASVAGRSAVRESSDEIEQLRKVAAKAPRFGKPLRQFLQSLDDRSRYFEFDPRAAVTAPPEPDPTAASKGEGFTGMESLLNYVYWQTLAVNQYDTVGHLLRVVAFESPCAAYHNGTSGPDSGIRFEQRGTPQFDEHLEDIFEQCNAWLGPYQPGITAPDPTDPGSKVAARARADREKAQRTGRVERRRRGPGEPEAPPIPGQADPSKPQIVLPPGVQELLDRLPDLGAQAPRSVDEIVPGVQQRGGQPGSEQLLDYLLG